MNIIEAADIIARAPGVFELVPYLRFHHGWGVLVINAHLSDIGAVQWTWRTVESGANPDHTDQWASTQIGEDEVVVAFERWPQMPEYMILPTVPPSAENPVPMSSTAYVIEGQKRWFAVVKDAPDVIGTIERDVMRAIARHDSPAV